MRAGRSAGSFARSFPRARVSQNLGVLFPSQDGLQHIATTFAQHIGRHRRQFQVGPFEYFLQAIDLLGSFLNQSFAIAREFTQLADRLGRNEAGVEQAMPQQIGYPFTLLHVGFAPRERLDVLGVDQKQGMTLFQNVVDRMPKHASLFSPAQHQSRKPVPRFPRTGFPIASLA